jgi:hypothetical protein
MRLRDCSLPFLLKLFEPALRYVTNGRLINPPKMFHYWRHIVTIYTLRCLTFDRGVLPALSGFATPMKSLVLSPISAASGARISTDSFYGIKRAFPSLSPLQITYYSRESHLSASLRPSCFDERKSAVLPPGPGLRSAVLSLTTGCERGR